MRIRLKSIAAFVVLSAGCLSSDIAFAETTVCDGGGAPGSGAGKITAVPFTISSPGVYCVTQKITSNLSSGAAITINANNVLLDLNDFAVGNLGAGNTTVAIGIFAVDRQNIHIRNGVLRGFWAGVALVNGTQIGLTTSLSSGHIVEGVVADTSYLVGISVQGPYVTVRGNKVMNTQGSNVANPTVPNAQNGANGILVGGGVGIQVVDNEIYNTDCTNNCTATTAGVQGIAVNPDATGAVVQNNILINQALSAITAPSAVQAIVFNSKSGTAASFDSIVDHNSMANWPQGIVFCNNAGAVCTGVMTNNVTAGVAAPYTGGSAPVATVGTNF